MRICIQTSRLELHPDQRDRIERRVGFALSRLAGLIRQVDVNLFDVNGPRGGIDKRCRALDWPAGVRRSLGTAMS